jgi:hypothetical protein
LLLQKLSLEEQLGASTSIAFDLNDNLHKLSFPLRNVDQFCCAKLDMLMTLNTKPNEVIIVKANKRL